jgi:protocatechuate 3,4-dioxygenase alpha subunit
MSRQTPSQTVGPYFAYGLVPEQYGFDLRNAFPSHLIGSTEPGPRVTLTGRVLDGAGDPVSDAMLEFGLDHGGETPSMCRVGTGTDPKFRYVVELPRPKARHGDAPHLEVIVTARGMLLHAFTRVYFGDEGQANAADETLTSVPANRRHTLMATPISPQHYQFDIHLQGEDETVFFEL